MRFLGWFESLVDALTKDVWMTSADPTGADMSYMRRALEVARFAKGVPGASQVGRVIVLDGKIVGEGLEDDRAELYHGPGDNPTEEEQTNV